MNRFSTEKQNNRNEGIGILGRGKSMRKGMEARGTKCSEKTGKFDVTGLESPQKECKVPRGRPGRGGQEREMGLANEGP